MGRLVAATVVGVVMWGFVSAVAQSPGAGAIEMKPIAATSGHGITNAPLIDRAEVRVLRVDVGPGGVRNVHTHDDVRFHLFIPISGTVRLQVGAEAPADVRPWQATYIPGGTRHGFTGIGGAPVTVMEVFVKP